MKFHLITLTSLILPFAALAAPGPAPAPSLDLDTADTIQPEVEVRDISPEALGLRKRAVRCYIVNSSSSTVNCRSGPGFKFSVVGSVKTGYSYPFNCYQSGDCYEGNCTWDQVPLDGGGYCYVNGYYTDSKCTAAALGKC